MNKRTLVRDVSKLSDYDKKILHAYSSIVAESAAKQSVQEASEKDILKASHRYINL